MAYFCETARFKVSFINEDAFETYQATLSPATQAAMAMVSYKGKAGTLFTLPSLEGFVFGVEGKAARFKDKFLAGKLALLLPEGDYEFEGDYGDAFLASFAFLAGQYRFTRYKGKPQSFKRLKLPLGVDETSLRAQLEATFMARDLINTPANDLGPEELADAARALATKHGANFKEIIGEDLLNHNFPLVYHVGKAATRAPRLVEFSWHNSSAEHATHKKITLIGKGVIYDTGGLNIKPGDSMFLMKKDMGGAAAALGLASMIMALDLPVRLRVIVPCVENAIAGNAFRAGDIYPSRKGLSVEIGNTDAEGRLILADALALADEESPDLLLDFATLTGAARVALGPDLPPIYAKSHALSLALQEKSLEVNDPVWAMPLFMGYDAYVEGKFSDLTSTPMAAFAGSITAALFLNRFVTNTPNHVHFDIYGWVPNAKGGQPMGGELQGARACLAYIQSIL